MRAPLNEKVLQRGDLLRVEWVDITEDSTADPDSADLSHRVSYGLFWAWAVRLGVRCLVTTTTVDKDPMIKTSGYCIYPEGCVLKVGVVRRAKRKSRGIMETRERKEGV